MNVPTTTRIETLTGVARRGDILMFPSKPSQPRDGLVKNVIGGTFRLASRGIQGDLTHSAIYAGNGTVINLTQADGLQRVPIKELATNRVVLLRPHVSKQLRDEAVDRIDSATIHYSIPKLLKTLVARVVKTKDTGVRIGNETCSSLIAKAYRNKLVRGRARDTVIPSDFLSSKRVEPIMDFQKTSQTETPSESELHRLMIKSDRGGGALKGAVIGTAMGAALRHLGHAGHYAPHIGATLGTIVGGESGRKHGVERKLKDIVQQERLQQRAEARVKKSYNEAVMAGFADEVKRASFAAIGQKVIQGVTKYAPKWMGGGATGGIQKAVTGAGNALGGGLTGGVRLSRAVGGAAVAAPLLIGGGIAAGRMSKSSSQY